VVVIESATDSYVIIGARRPATAAAALVVKLSGYFMKVNVTNPVQKLGDFC
jgi:HAMP domain-containing protein